MLIVLVGALIAGFGIWQYRYGKIRSSFALTYAIMTMVLAIIYVLRAVL